MRKKFHLIFFILCTHWICSTGQSLVKERRVWSNTWIGTERTGLYESYSIKFEGAKILNDKSYKIIMRSDNSLQNNWYQNGYIREDSLGRVFRYNSNSQAGEDLLFDYSKKIGDSIPTNYHGYVFVNNIEYIQLEGFSDSLRQFYISLYKGSDWETVFIEGLGSLEGVLCGIDELGMVGAEKSLVCFQENDTLKYMNPDFSTCFPYQLDDYIPNIKYREFATFGARWYYSNREDPLGGSDQGYLEIHYIGDTLIENMEVKTLEKIYYACDGSINHLGFEYIYNEDRRVYYYKDKRFNLLYDFNAEEGDTLTFREPYFTNTTADSTFSVVVDRTEIVAYRTWLDLKVIYSHTITGPWDLYNVHIEKIGNIPYMFPQISLACDAQCYEPFRGYLDYQLNYWGDGYGPFNYRDIINDIHYENPNEQIKVYPNPFSDDIKIEGLPCIELSLTLYDLTGRLIFKKIIQSNGSHKITTSQLNPGIYLLNLKDTRTGYCYKNQIIIKDVRDPSQSN